VRFYHPDPKSLVALESHVVKASDDYAHAWANLTGFSVQPSNAFALAQGEVSIEDSWAAEARPATLRGGVRELVRLV